MDDPTNLPLGVLTAGRNIKFHLTSARTRDGIQTLYGFSLPAPDDTSAVTGLIAQKVGGPAGDLQVPLAFSALGNLYIESPAGSGRVQQITGANVTPGVVLPAGAQMLAQAAFKRAYLAFSDLKNSKAPPAVYNPTLGFLDPLGMKPVGIGWLPLTAYQIGEVVTPPTPIGGNGHSYRCTVAGTSGAMAPAFPVGVGATVGDGTVTWKELTPVMTQTGVGNICSGLRYMVVLYVNRNGYISGMTAASVVSANFGSSGTKLTASPIPIGPANTVARICAFTPAGQLNQLAGTGISNAGPYFWIPPSPNWFQKAGIFDLTQVPDAVTVAEVVNGVVMNSTLINDNISTAVTFNFTDDYLKATLNEVSSYFRKMQVPPCSDLYYSKTLRRMFYADDNLPSGWRVSLQDDPETIYSDTSTIVEAAENNGENRTAVREYDTNVYLMKEKSGHILTPNADDPSKWNVREQWTGSGPCGPRAVDVGLNFMCYVHRSGIYIFQGSKPFPISKEIPLTMAAINWAYQHTIWVLVDDESKEIRIGVPIGQSTVPSLVMKCNYEELPRGGAEWDEHPIHFSPYIGKEIATGACYKWSFDDIAANLAVRAERTLLNLPDGFDSATSQSQILYASSNPDGAVAAVTPDTLDDNGVGIDSYLETAAPQDLMRPNQLGGVQANIAGTGTGSVEILALRAKQGDATSQVVGGKPAANAGFVKKLKKPWIAGVPYSCGASGQNERFRLRISNNKTKGVGFDIKWAAIYARPVASARPR